MTAVFQITHAGPGISVQDGGRFGYMRFGVTPGGPMDRLGHRFCNVALGNAPGAAAIEVSSGGLALTCQTGNVTAAIAGGGFRITLNGQAIAPWSRFTITQGARLEVKSGAWGSWCYLGFAGILDSPIWLGSAATHAGLCGATLKTGDTVRIIDPVRIAGADIALPDPAKWQPSKTCRIVAGPQDRYFADDALGQLCADTYTLTSDYNRMGVRLSGSPLHITGTLDMPSEPIQRGALQVPGHGEPICLLADHQTAGGYPRIATLVSADQDAFAQLRVGDVVRFERVGADKAAQIARDHHRHVKAFDHAILTSANSLTDRLWQHNLIGGTVNAADPD